MPHIVIYGSEGTLIVPDPNGFGGEPLIRAKGEQEYRPLPLTHGFTENARGIGVLDMAYAIREGRSPRASGQLALHVLEAMHAFDTSSKSDKHVYLTSRAEKPEPMAPDTYADEVTA
jgi:predicted dehydrogenase